MTRRTPAQELWDQALLVEAGEAPVPDMERSILRWMEQWGYRSIASAENPEPGTHPWKAACVRMDLASLRRLPLVDVTAYRGTKNPPSDRVTPRSFTTNRGTAMVFGHILTVYEGPGRLLGTFEGEVFVEGPMEIVKVSPTLYRARPSE